MQHIVFVFLDGVGLGPADGAANPFEACAYDTLEQLAGRQRWTGQAVAVFTDDHLFRPIDACLSMPGLPQSGTGQATLFTGVNCAAEAGRHYGPFPHSKNRETLARHNVFAQVQHLFPDAEEPAAFANAYPPRFFKMASSRNRWTVTTRCCLDAGVRIRTASDVHRGTALTAELTGAVWRERLQIDIPVVTEQAAGRRLARLARAHAFTLFEFFLTDKAGHSQSLTQASEILGALDRFFAGFLQQCDLNDTLLVVTSDHGNLEDLTTKSHTRNPVPLIVLGKGASAFHAVSDLAEVTPAVVGALKRGA